MIEFPSAALSSIDDAVVLSSIDDAAVLFSIDDAVVLSSIDDAAVLFLIDDAAASSRSVALRIENSFCVIWLKMKETQH